MKTVSQIALQAIEFVKSLTQLRNSKHSPAIEYTEMSPDEKGNPNWLTFCPAHNDVNHPSLHISFSDKLLFHCRAGCSQEAIITKFKELGLWTQQKPRLSINNPPHEIPDDDFLYNQLMSENGDHPDEVYTYTDDKGSPLFWILRLNSKPKIIKPLCSVTFADGKKGFQQVHFPNNRPLYNLAQIAISNVVLLFEGEKSVEAARKFFHTQCLATWSGGTGAIHQTNWNLLENKSILLFPDNDDAGIKAMEKIASILLKKGCKVKIAFREIQKDLKKGADIADLEENSDLPEQWYNGMQELTKDDIGEALDAEFNEFFNDYNKRLQRLSLGSKVYLIDITKRDGGLFKFIDYRSFEYGKTDCYAFEPAQVQPEGKKVPVYAIDEWVKTTNNMYIDFTYKPSENNWSILNKDKRYFNTFAGFKYTPVKGEGHKLFIDHLELLLQENSEYFLDWLAHMVQIPEEKPGTFMLLKGPQGTGKSFTGYMICELLGETNSVTINAGYMAGGFNGLISSKLFVYIDEFAMQTRNNKKLASDFKSLITVKDILINDKFIPTRSEQSFHRFMSTTNDQIPYTIDIDSRRDIVFQVPIHKYTKDTKYFKEFNRTIHSGLAMNHFMHFLINRKITYNVFTAPETEAREDMFQPSDIVDAFIYQICYLGEFPGDLNFVFKKDILVSLVTAWPNKDVILPRDIVCNTIKGKSDINETIITRKLHKILGKYDFKHLFTFNLAISTNTYTYYGAQRKAFVFPPLKELRKIFDEHIGKSTNWPEIHKSDNVISFPGPDTEGDDIV